MDSIRLLSRAKVNLYLDVLDDREDGYFNLEMVIQEIDLCDHIFLEKRNKNILVECDHQDVPKNEENLAYKAAKLLKDTFNIKEGVNIKVEKRIPVASGLGGGSSNAAAVLRGLNKLWELSLDNDRLIDLARQIGMDVPFFILGGTCIATGRGDLLKPITPTPDLWFVLCCPNVRVSTSWVYSELRKPNSSFSLTRKNDGIRIIIEDIKNRNIAGIKNSIYNKLEEITASKYNIINSIKEKLMELGVSSVLMSGSGSCVFGICDEAEIANIKNVLVNLYKEGVYVARSVSGA